ncbi:kinesin-like nuclear fusion protein [Ophidiomyces ophidiicola]|nr:kinesin-like nuclear fusion protein [Ophidiomyces ophidiicola]
MDAEENAGRSSAIPRLTRSQTRGTFKDITTATINTAGQVPRPNGFLKRKGDSTSTDVTSKRKPTPSKARPLHCSSKSVGSATVTSPHSRTISSSASIRSTVRSSHYVTRSNAISAAAPCPRDRARPKTSFGYTSMSKASQARSVTAMDTAPVNKSIVDAGKRKGANPSSPVHSSNPPQPMTPTNQESHYCHMSFKPNRMSSLATKIVETHEGCISCFDSLCEIVRGLTIESDKPPGVSLLDIQRPLSVASRLPCRTSPSKFLSSCTPISPSPSLASSIKSSRHSRRAPSKVNRYLTRYSHVQGWDQDEKEETLEAMFGRFMHQFKHSTSHSTGLQEAIDLYKYQVRELEQQKIALTDLNVSLRVEIDSIKLRLQATESKWRDDIRLHETTVGNLDSQRRHDIQAERQEAKANFDLLGEKHQRELFDLQHRLESRFEEERAAHVRELDQINVGSALQRQREQSDMENKKREVDLLQVKIDKLHRDLDREVMVNKELQANLATANGNTLTLESSIRALKARIEFLESGNKEQSDAFARLDQELNDAITETKAAKEKLRKEETLRRKLHNQVQELKGNIRVFCRVRPLLETEPKEESANIQFPDCNMEAKQITVQGPQEKSSRGSITAKNHGFSFDHVFGPRSQNSDVFEELSQVVQSALDGYNVCIFCYGQTGSGKTHTMSSEDGMIPKAVAQIYQTAADLEERGWKYTMEGSFVEVYNESLNDLLGNAEDFDKKRHEIRHDIQKSQTTITNTTIVTLDSPATVELILRQAAANRSVASTKANWRSSRSHSVFILKLIGENAITEERSESTLNLVDLAGSERLTHSGATGDRLKETQNINRSLSCLGDVIGALGQGKEGGHIPYRNSKLTYLLQFSLGGNSKTLMLVMISPRQEHLSETLTSLRFATKVQNTHIGTAKKQTRVIRDS